MIDVKAARNWIRDYMSSENPSAHNVTARYRDALDELEALRKPAPCRFDTAAAREEMARIDEEWGDEKSIEDVRAHAALVALLDKALAAIDADVPSPETMLWPGEGAYLCARVGRSHDDWLALTTEQRHAYHVAASGRGLHPDCAPAGPSPAERLVSTVARCSKATRRPSWHHRSGRR